MSEVVYTYEHGDVFTLKVIGKNSGRYEAYCKRINADGGGRNGLVEYLEPCGKHTDVPKFFETRYFVRCDFKDKTIDGVFVNHKMASVSDAFDFDGSTLVGTLDFVNTPGKFRFEIVWTRCGVRENAVFEWMVVSEKLDVQDDYGKIVKTIEQNAPGLVRAFLAKSRGEAGLVRMGEPADTVWADIFGGVADRYQRACEWVSDRPHLKYVSEVEYRKAGLVKRWTPELVNRFARMDDGRRNVALFRTEYISPQVDTVENRFVKFTLKAIAGRIGKFAAVCKEHKSVSESFVRDFELRGEKLSRILRKPFFSGVGRFTGFRQESMVLQRKRGYAEIYAAWLMLQKTIDAARSGFSTGHRPISTLYEFWCFLCIADFLEKDFGFGIPEGRIEGARAFDDLFEEPDPDKIDTTTLSALRYEFPEKDGTVVRLLYQQNYGESGEDFAYYNPQRPDIVLVIERGGNTFTYLFDAKYRIDIKDGLDASPAGPINDMHRYRDAILYRAQKGEEKLSRQIVGAYVLYPGRPVPMSYNYKELIEHENIGAIPLLPGAEGTVALKEFVGEILGKKDAQEHLGKVFPTRGTSVVVGEAFSEAAIPTIDLHGNEWPKLTDEYNKYITIPISQVEKLPKKLPALVRLKSNNKAEVIVKVVSYASGSGSNAKYNIEWTPSGYLQGNL